MSKFRSFEESKRVSEVGGFRGYRNDMIIITSNPKSPNWAHTAFKNKVRSNEHRPKPNTGFN